MAKKPTFYRMTISIPAELKKRMDAVTQSINWSAIAAEAYEQKLKEIASTKEKPDMTELIQRLRDSTDNEMEQEGRHDGKTWAWHTATRRQLERLHAAELETQTGIIVGQPMAPLRRADIVAFAILGTRDSERDNEVAADFWEKAAHVAPNDPQYGDDEYLQGFIDGALSVWESVQDKM